MNSNRKTIMTFISDIIAFIDGKFASDTRISSAKKPLGHLAFSTELVEKNTKHFYVIQCINNATKDETFNEVATLSVTLEITIFALKGNFDGATYLAEPMSIVLQDVISDYMSQLKFDNANENICLMRELGSSPAIPYENGARAYTSTLRYEFTIDSDYISTQQSN